MRRFLDLSFFRQTMQPVMMVLAVLAGVLVPLTNAQADGCTPKSVSVSPSFSSNGREALGTVLSSKSYDDYALRCEGIQSFGAVSMKRTQSLTPASTGSNVCATTVPGIGIRMSGSGGALPCAANASIALEARQSAQSIYGTNSLGGRFVVEIIKTGDVAPGSYDFTDTSTQEILTSGATFSAGVTVNGHGKIIFSCTSMTDVTVDFGSNSSSDVISGAAPKKQFDIALHGCPNPELMRGRVALTIRSLQGEGDTVWNHVCIGCATNVGVKIAPVSPPEGDGVFAINEKYVPSDPVIGVDSLTYKHTAELVARDGMKGGRINATATVVVTYQ